MSLEPSAQPEPTPAPAAAEQPVTTPPSTDAAALTAPDTAITTAPAVPAQYVKRLWLNRCRPKNSKKCGASFAPVFRAKSGARPSA